MLRRALDALCLKLDGKEAAAKTARRKRAAFNEVLNICRGEGLLHGDPPQRAQVERSSSQRGGGPGCRLNRAQVAQLLTAVAQQRGRGPHLEAFFGCMYYAAMRPAEVIHLRLEQSMQEWERISRGAESEE
ncbi:hypothetical protein [Streptomyces neyagawaensis]|uniref:hypothetical protein n=1 Tax=Streptomyces neyagawaensis TaxID=42238 RepID=UPI000A680E66|nr:hypothetical protein [Streptomyces neyagawaensis]MCL6735857.1 hypothetical protein [Streptomyces neyagawaensis]MDE1686337.1 hypothetical protein [Streptomyces neyagawaensis]